MDEQTKLIYNPVAGKGSAAKNLPRVQALLAEHGLEYGLQLTEHPGHATQLAREATEDGIPLVIVAGGDGTVNESLNGIMTARLNGHPRPALAVLPVGRGNDFAYGMNIPTTLVEAVDVLALGYRRTADVGRVSGGDFPEGRYFGNGVGLGFDTMVGFEAAKIKWLHGAASYLVGLARTIFLYSKAPVYEIQMDDGESVQKAFLMVSVMNGRRMGGAFHMTPESDPSDGTFDLCLAGYVPQLKILSLATRFIAGTQKDHPAVTMARAKKITIRAVDGSIPAHADGETICTAGQSLSIELYPASLEVVTRSA